MSPRLFLLPLIAIPLLAGCSATPDGFGGGASVMRRMQPAVAVDSAALAERVGGISGQADRCGFVVDLERNKKMLHDFEKKLGRTPEAIEGTMLAFESAFTRGLNSGCPMGNRSRIAEDLILIEDGQMNALMAK